MQCFRRVTYHTCVFNMVCVGTCECVHGVPVKSFWGYTSLWFLEQSVDNAGRIWKFHLLLFISQLDSCVYQKDC